MRRVNMWLFTSHGVGWLVIAALPSEGRFTTGFSAFVAGVASAFALVCYLESR